jgi:hypothetical protein
VTSTASIFLHTIAYNLHYVLFVIVNIWNFVVFQNLFFERIQFIPPLISTSKLQSHPDILGIRKFLESGNSWNLEILGIWKFLESGNSGTPEILKTVKSKTRQD